MDYPSFIDSLLQDEPPTAVSVYLQALWFDAKGSWQQAHELVQDIDSRPAASIHAYLHRKEGDTINAAYWYRRAGMDEPDISLEDEWEDLVRRIYEF